MKNEAKKSGIGWIFIVIGLFMGGLFLMFLLILFSMLYGFDESNLKSGNVAIIEIKGALTVDRPISAFGASGRSVDDIIDLIEKADENPSVEAIIFEINSPGGTAVASEELARAIKDTDKLTVAWIREVGASGAYWAASACDHIIASRMSITGSVGVIGSYIDFSGLMNDYNVTYQRLVGGKYKDIGSPYKDLSVEERIILQDEIDTIHEIFKQDVKMSRDLSDEMMIEVGTGLFFTGEKAISLGLIDEWGGKSEAIEYIERELNMTTKIVKYEEKRGLLDVLATAMNENFFYVGRGIGSFMEPETYVVKT